MARLLGYLVGGLFVLAMLSPIPVTFYLLYDRITVSALPTVSAVITECYYHRKSNSSAASFGPVAVTAEEHQIRGEWRWNRRSWCERSIGDRVTVLLDSDDPQNSRIVTFEQFFALPLLMSLITFVAYPALVINHRKKRRKH